MEMSKAQHTQGPWKILPEECTKPYIRIRGTVLGGRYKVANVLAPAYEGVPDREREETVANARRIVACVNACEGISTKALESDVIKELLVTAQTLIEALNYKGDDANEYVGHAELNLEAAIAKATDEQP